MMMSYENLVTMSCEDVQWAFMHPADMSRPGWTDRVCCGKRLSSRVAERCYSQHHSPLSTSHMHFVSFQRSTQNTL
jgi:hypothetical protein